MKGQRAENFVAHRGGGTETVPLLPYSAGSGKLVAWMASIDGLSPVDGHSRPIAFLNIHCNRENVRADERIPLFAPTTTPLLSILRATFLACRRASATLRNQQVECSDENSAPDRK